MAEKLERIGFILNPIAGRCKAGAYRERLQKIIRDSGKPFVWVESERPGHATTLARELVEMGIRTIIACGGDGTVNEVGTALAGVPDVRFGIVPLGCGNDFVRTVASPRDPEDACRLFLSDSTKTIRSDCGQINDRYFFNNLGIGFDGAVVITAEKVNRLKNPYTAGVARHIFTFREFQVDLRTDGKPRMSEPIFIFVASIGKAYGGGIYITPDAELGDGLMDMLVVPRTKWWKRPRLFWLVTRKKHLKDSAFRFFRGRNVEMELGEQRVPAHVDGMRLTLHGTVRIQVIPEALTLITGD